MKNLLAILFILSTTCVYSEVQNFFEGYNGFVWGTGLQEIQKKTNITYNTNDGVCDIYIEVFEQDEDDINDAILYARGYYFHENKLLFGRTRYLSITHNDIDKLFFQLEEKYGKFEQGRRLWNSDETELTASYFNKINENLNIVFLIHLNYSDSLNARLGNVEYYTCEIIFENEKKSKLYSDFIEKKSRKFDF